MKTALCLLALLAFADVAHAQHVIEWSRERRLVRDDFQGRAPTGATKFSMSWLNVEASWECKGGQLISSVRATFDPARSWWRTTTGSVWSRVDPSSGIDRIQADARRGAEDRDRQLLEHEQLHFDLAELAAARLRSRFEEMKSACGSPDGEAALHDAVMSADRALQQEQARFDTETSHGSSDLVQSQWRARIIQQLDQLSHSTAPGQQRRR